jgi:glycosyltransferase involved in cell wall biosynthesis
MRILFLPKLLPRADVIGGPILIYHRIKNLSRMGHGVGLIAPAYDEADWSDNSLQPFCHKVIKIRSTTRRSEEEVTELSLKLQRPATFLEGDGAYDENIERALLEELRRGKYDFVIAEYSMMGQYIEANRSAIPAPTRAVISVHECYTRAHELRRQKGEEISERFLNDLREYEFRMYLASDLLLTLTAEDAQILGRYEPRLKDRIRVVPHGVDTEFYHPPEKKTWERESANILYLGNFRHHPNVDAVKNFLKHCWAKVKARVPGVRFYAIGYAPPEELLEVARCDPAVVVRPGGTDEQVREIYWQSDVFVAPIELGTGFRGKLLEAMACGLPVVATSLATYGINPRHGVEMFVTDNYEQFARYLIMLLTDRKLRRRMSEAAIRLGRSFDHREAARKLEAALLGG